MTSCSASKISEGEWALSIDVKAEERQDAPVAVHFVIDNSYSMGSVTKVVQDVFSEMVDSVATAPCSMTVFNEKAKILSSSITSGQQMRDLKLPGQGMTNIPAGIQLALRVIFGQEMKAKKTAQTDRVHHILVLLSDGDHSSGPKPAEVFPALGSMIPEDTKLSVVVVGYTGDSNTSMGMLLKKSIETVPFDAGSVQTIYFASTRPDLRSALSSIESGLNTALKGSFHEIEAETASLIQNFASVTQSAVRVHLGPRSKTLSLLYTGENPPNTLVVDGRSVEVSIGAEPEVDVLSQIIQTLIDRTKVEIVALKDNTELIARSVGRLDSLIKVIESKSAGNKTLQLRSVSPGDRVRAFRDIRAACNGARELRNQVLDIANFSKQSSEDQATFLNGRSMKYANKALRRAAKRSNGIVDPKAERRAILKRLLSSEFTENLQHALVLDVAENLLRLPDAQVNNVLLPRIRAINPTHALGATEIREKLSRRRLEDVQVDSINRLGLSVGARELLLSGRLAEYLNDWFHNKRQSYLSLLSPWQHAEEWMHFSGQPDFESTWEMLMYGGFVGYPLMLAERSAGCQMNPYLLKVKGVRYSLADTASMCCANQAEVPVYGPEGGEPIQDLLVLIDPSAPRASKLVCNGALLGEKFTSATVSRDLQMYTGINMRVALHSNTLFRLLAEPPQEASKEDDVIADLRRALLGRAFMCADCGFGPVDHFACGDLMAHHGEHTGGGVTVSNACPKCSWFSSDLDDWLPWDGAVCEDFIAERKREQRATKQQAAGSTLQLTEAKIDLVLRILYSLRKNLMCGGASSIRDQCAALSKELVAKEERDFSTKAGVDGMSQVLLAMVNPFDGEGHREVFADRGAAESCLLAIIHEACVRDARKRFRIKAGGVKEKARKLAADFLTKLLSIRAKSAPEALPPMESEPPTQNVRMDCADDFQLKADMAAAEIRWVRDVAREWCRAWSFSKALSELLETRDGGWNKLERDMETGTFAYQDVIATLKTAKAESPRDVFGMEETTDVQALFLRIGVSAIFNGVAEVEAENDQPALASLLVEQEDGILHTAAREMRMLIYFEQVRAKMAVWKVDGEQQTFLMARTEDIAQYSGRLSVKAHVHAFDKATFWGLWRAAKNTKHKAKIAAFLSTANEEFAFKHS